MLPIIHLTNWTGHWDAICSPGQTLIFNITHDNKTESFEILADNGAPFRKDIKRGDLIRVSIQDLDRNVLLRGSKEFFPVEGQFDQFGIEQEPGITVCQIDRLDMGGF